MFSSLTPSYLLKVAKFWVKISQFELLFMIQKNIFVYQQFFVIKYFRFQFIFYVTPLILTNLPLKIKFLSSPPFWPPQQKGGGGVQTISLVLFVLINTLVINCIILNCCSLFSCSKLVFSTQKPFLVLWFWFLFISFQTLHWLGLLIIAVNVNIANANLKKQL